MNFSQTPTAHEERTRLLLADLNERSTREHNGVQIDSWNTDTADLAASHVVSAVAANLVEHTNVHLQPALPLTPHIQDLPRSSADHSEDDSEGSDHLVAQLMAVLDPCSLVITHICHLCVNCYSNINGKQSESFLTLLAQLLEICPFYQPTMGFVLSMPAVLTIPSCHTFFEDDESINNFLFLMVDYQQKRNKTRGSMRQMWQKMHRMLRMEGIEDDESI
ncbi:hypothetical protein BLNAU_9840 [Blattamonas nauphoetae]|uniref:Uncharacterized protein n=1 Tax=Blattamonas nauphoetae TaxID=2049346 RepID=A0ABQ9XUG9_9EUKA|nr:hypothetical protein BLNAU_9840 [Blattamonas nauphoetae]